MSWTLLRMLKTRKYYPAASWVIPKAGNGMDSKRASFVWKIMKMPQESQCVDIENIFFMESRSFRYFGERKEEGIIDAEEDLVEDPEFEDVVPDEDEEAAQAVGAIGSHENPIDILHNEDSPPQPVYYEKFTSVWERSTTVDGRASFLKGIPEGEDFVPLGDKSPQKDACFIS